MMDYETFKEIMADQIVNYMPGFENCAVKIESTLKINQTLDGLELYTPGLEKLNATIVKPRIYINPFYEEYKRSGNLKEVLETAASELLEGYREKIESKPENILKSAEEKLVMQLINTEQNKELLKTLPHREFQDLSIIYRIVVDMVSGGIRTALVDKKMAKKIGMREGELYEAAMKNTKRLFPPEIKPMEDVLREMMGEVVPLDMVGLMVNDIPPEMALYVISNKQNINGAVSILYDDGLYELADKIGSDLYIMPSSIHEAIAISANAGEPEELAKMVADINMTNVKLDERLSNQVYHYDKELRKLSLATDTPNKRLDQIVAEPFIYQTKQSR